MADVCYIHMMFTQSEASPVLLKGASSQAVVNIARDFSPDASEPDVILFASLFIGTWPEISNGHVGLINPGWFSTGRN
mgnify:CR=1 FL=1